MSVIEAASAGVKDMADGSLRITLEFEPRHAKDAYALFGARGTAVAVAALKAGSGAIAEPPAPAPEKPKGGEWAKLAGMWCADKDFWTWLNYENGFAGIHQPDVAAVALRGMCEIDSRAELDNDPDALDRFNMTVRRPFMKWMQTRGIQK